MIQFSSELHIGPQVRLRFYTPADVEPLSALIDENRAHLRAWFPWVDSSGTPKDSAAFIERAAKQAAAGTGAHYMIEQDGYMAGTIGFHDVSDTNRSAMIGYWLAASHTGRGLMTTCATRLLDYAFADLKLNRVAIAAAVDNRKSRAVAERLGMVIEGTQRQVEWLYDRFVDHVIYSRLHSEHCP